MRQLALALVLILGLGGGGAEAQTLSACVDDIAPSTVGGTSVFRPLLPAQCTWPREGNLSDRVYFWVGVQDGVTVGDDRLDAIADALRTAAATAATLGDGIKYGREIRVVLAANRNAGAEGEARYESGRDWSHCNLALTPDAYADTVGHLKLVVAHELFHCIQDGTWGPTYFQARALGTEPDPRFWYLEGGADWFAHHAIVEADLERLRTFEYRTKIWDFTRMEYATWPFWSWFAERNGAQEAFRMLGNIAAGIDNAKEIVALLDDEEWYAFATAYAAFQITLPGGRRVVPAVRDHRPTEEVRDDKEQEFRVPLGTIRRAKLVFEPGKWELTPGSGGTVFMSGLLPNGDPDGAWFPIDGTVIIETACDTGEEFVIASFGVKPDEEIYTFDIKRIDDTCETSCEKLPETFDQCLIGRWRDDTWQEPTEATSPGTELVHVDHPAPIWTFYDNGLFRSDGPFVMETLTTSVEGWIRVLTHYRMSAALGYWGTQSGKLYVCEDEEVYRGFQVMSSSAGVGGRGSLYQDVDLVAEGQERDMRFTYKCEGNTLTMRSGLLGFVRGEFSRVGAAPEVDDAAVFAPHDLLPIPEDELHR